jgi:hypothetical protein
VLGVVVTPDGYNVVLGDCTPPGLSRVHPHTLVFSLTVRLKVQRTRGPRGQPSCNVTAEPEIQTRRLTREILIRINRFAFAILALVKVEVTVTAPWLECLVRGGSCDCPVDGAKK